MSARAPASDRVRLLLVEDNPGDVGLLREHLSDSGGAAPLLEVVESLGAALESLRQGEASFDVVLLDLGLPDSQGLATLESLLEESGAGPPVVVLTGQSGGDLGIRALRKGAHDFIPKDQLSAPVLDRAVRHAIERWRAERALRGAEGDLRAANRRLADANRLLRTTFDSLDDAVFLVHVESRLVLDCNRAAEEIFGYGRDEIIGESTAKLHLDAEVYARFGSELKVVLDDRETFRSDLRMRSRDGTVFPTRHVVKALESADGLPEHVVSVVHDLTEKEARESRIRFQAMLLDQVGEAVIATDANQIITYWNRSARDLLGWTEEEALGRPVALIRPPEDEEDALQREAVLQEGGSLSREVMVRRKDGSTFHALVSLAPLVDPGGDQDGTIRVLADISDRVRMAEELEETNRALRVVSAANRAVLESTDEGEILEETCRIAVEEGGYAFAWIGWAERDPEHSVRPAASWGPARGFLDSITVSWSEGEFGQGPAGRAIRNREPAVSRNLGADSTFGAWSEEAAKRGFGSELAVPLLSEGECLGALMVYARAPDAFDEPEVRILSELGADLAHGILVHRSREQRKAVEARLGEAEKLRAVGQLAGGVAHDFNNYLSVITTLADFLLEDEELGEQQRRDLEEIRSAAESGAILTRQLLTFGKRERLQPRVLDLNEAVRKTAKMLDTLLGEEIRVSLELDEAALPVRLDPGHVEQVIMNLAINARDAMPGGGNLTIRTRREARAGDGRAEDEPRTLLAFADTGVGMNEETRHRIFEPFFTTRDTGTGLGLATVYGIVTEAGGEIEVESEPGRGTTFRVLLPPAPGGEETVAPPEGDAGDLTGSEPILVLEDQDPLRRVTRRVLERYGYRVLGAASVEEAVRIGRERELSIALVLADVRLPDGSGPEAVERLLQDRPELKVIFTSGYPAEDLGGSTVEELGGRFIQKPFEPDALARLVRETLDSPPRNG